MCGIFGIANHKEASRVAFLGLYALQHRGEESAGIAAFNGGKITSHLRMGLAADAFKEGDIKKLKGETAIGHVRYSTTGSSSPGNIQPFLARVPGGQFAVSHNGNLTNAHLLRKEMEKNGSIFQTGMDSEVIAHLVAASPKGGIGERLVSALACLEGAFSLVMLFDSLLIGARDRKGYRPLCLGRLNGSYCLASESCALDLIQAEYVRDIEPGEIVLIDKDKIESFRLNSDGERAFCVFEYIYFARPDSLIFTSGVYSTRKELGRALAKEAPVEADLVMPVPDSGNYAALGFAEQSGIPLEFALIRNHYIGRTFIQPSQFIRDFRVKVKLNPVREVLQNKRLVIVEDSIVRGTTSRLRVKALRAAGAKEVHMRVSCPPLRFPCFYGIDFPTKKELIASGHSLDWIKNYIGLDSLAYLSMAGMLQAMPLEKKVFCKACFDGSYPREAPKKLAKNRLER